MKSLFDCCAEAVGAGLTFIWLKDTLVGCTAAEVSDLNSLSCGNSVPNQFFKLGYNIGHFCHVLDYQYDQINQQRLGITMMCG